MEANTEHAGESDEEPTDVGASDQSPAADTPPAAPAADDSPLGDTDQHSDA